jgi:hypothetical protein
MAYKGTKTDILYGVAIDHAVVAYKGTGTRLLARVLKEGVQFWYNDTSTVKSGGGFEKTFLWKAFDVYVTSCQYLLQARLKFFKHTWLCEFVPPTRYTIKLIKMSNV